MFIYLNAVDELMTTMLTATADIINLKDEYEGIVKYNINLIYLE